MIGLGSPLVCKWTRLAVSSARSHSAEPLSAQPGRALSFTLQSQSSSLMDLCPNCDLLRDDELGVASNDPRQQLEKLDSEIARLEARLEQMKGKRVSLRRQINRLCAPILRLPPELSSKIFLAYLPLYEFYPQKELAHTPLAFGRICSDWRNQAWSMPWLWTRIRVYLSDRCSPTVSALLEEWLTLSMDLPLCICLVHKGGDSENPNFTAITTVVASLCERWHSIKLTLSLPLFRAFRCVQGRLTLLTSVKLYTTYDSHVMDDAVQLFNVAPRLQQADIGFDWNGPILPMAQLTHLTTRPRDFELCLDILRSSPRLVKAYFSEVRPSDATMLTPVTAPQLRSLELYTRRGPSGLISGFLDALTLPSLCELALHGGTDKVSIHDSLISLTDRSSYSLTHLKLSHFLIPADHIIECFRAVPSVTYLELTWISGVKTNDIIQMLDPSRTSQSGSTYILLPNLGNMSVTGEYVDWSDVANMLACRWSSPTATLTSVGSPLAQLRHFSVDTTGDDLIGEHAATVIQGLEAEGMDIWINPFLFQETSQ